uniref:Uncharacterized protein n=1 Tax=Terrapene triunguis TaxID=2587831 RepID=A0A674I5M3_9SAUR
MAEGCWRQMGSWWQFLLLYIPLSLPGDLDYLEGNGGWLTNKYLALMEEDHCTVERRDASLTYSQFIDQYAFSRPVVIQGITDNSEFQALCTRNKLLAEFGDRLVRLSTANTYSYRKGAGLGSRAHALSCTLTGLAVRWGAAPDRRGGQRGDRQCLSAWPQPMPPFLLPWLVGDRRSCLRPWISLSREHNKPALLLCLLSLPGQNPTLCSWASRWPSLCLGFSSCELDTTALSPGALALHLGQGGGFQCCSLAGQQGLPGCWAVALRGE